MNKDKKITTEKTFGRVWFRLAVITGISSVIVMLIGAVVFVGAFLAQVNLTSLKELLIPIIIVVLFSFIIGAISTVATATVITRDTSLGSAIAFGLRKGYSFIMPMIIATLLVLGGTVLLVIPGLIIGTRLMPLMFVWIENQERGSWEIVKKTFKLTGGETFWQLLLAVVLLYVAVVVMDLIFSFLPEIIGGTISFLVHMAIVTPLFLSFIYSEYTKAKAKPQISDKK